NRPYMLCQDGWRLAGGRSFGGLAGRRRRALTGTRGAHADSDGLLRLSRPDDDRNTSRPGYEIASRTQANHRSRPSGYWTAFFARADIREPEGDLLACRGCPR